MAQLTVPTILAWDSDAIFDAFRIAKDREGTFTDFGENLKRVHNTVGEWGGTAGEAFHQSMGKRRADIEADGRESARVAKAIARAEHDVDSVQIRMRAAVSFLNKNHINVAEDGTLTAQSGYETDPNTRKVLAAQVKTGNGLTVSEIMADANHVDEELASAIRAAVGDEQLDQDGRPIPGTQQAPSTPGVTAEQLLQIMTSEGHPLSQADAERYAPLLSQAMQEFGIDTPVKKAAFLAQLAAETGGLTQWSENSPASDFSIGRGPIQLTGRSNYEAAAQKFGIPLLDDPSLASDPKYAFRIAAWFVTENSSAMDTLGDGGWGSVEFSGEYATGTNGEQFAQYVPGTGTGFDGMSNNINGGMAGWKARDDFYVVARSVMGAPPIGPYPQHPEETHTGYAH